MSRRSTRLILGAALLGAAALGATVPVTSQAATPASGTLSFAHPKVSWQGTNMAGSAPAVRRYTCAAPQPACDDFRLTINRGTDGLAEADLSLNFSAGASGELYYYAPGCSTDPASTCYAGGGTSATFHPPANGVWTIRVTCTACPPASSYTMTATLKHVPYPPMPSAGNQTFGWHQAALPGQDGSTQFGEPGIAINKHGRIIVNTFGPTVWISKDDGRTFSNPNPGVDTTGCPSGDADAQVSFDDVMYADNLCLGGGTNLSYTSRDLGKTWNPDRAGLPAFGGTDVDRQWYAVDPKQAGVVYMSYHDLEGPNIWVLKSTDYGQTFPQAVPVTVAASNFVDTGEGNTTNRILIDPITPNTLTLLYASNTAAKSATAPPTNQDFDLNEFYMARSTDGGLTWTNTKLLDAGQTAGQDNTVAHEFPNASIDSAGNIYLAYSERLGNSTQTHIVFAVLPRGSTHMSKPVQVDSGTGANVFPWIAAGEPGMVDITWYGSLAKDNNNTHAAWSEMFAQTLNGLSARPTFNQSNVTGTTPMHQADICLAGTLCLATGGNRNLADFQGVDVDPCGYAQLVWTDDHTGTGLTDYARQTGGTTVRPHAAGCTASPAAAVRAHTATRARTAPQAAGRQLPRTGPGPWTGVATVGAALALLTGLAFRRRTSR